MPEEKEELKLPVVYADIPPYEKHLVREQYIGMQEEKCWYCKEDLGESAPKRITDKKINWRLFPKGFLDYPIHLQHSHDTGLTEGAVHNYCNAVLWQYEGK